MNIGEVARRSGLPAKTIRFYEDIGLVQPNARRPNGYRDFDQRDLHELRFVARARSLGFTVDECRALLDLYRNRSRASAEVKAIAAARMTEIDAKIESLQDMKATLSHLIARCHGDDRPDCPILEDLAGARCEQPVMRGRRCR